MVERYKKARLLENSLCIFDIDIDRMFRVSKLLTLASYFFKLWTTAIFLIGCSIGRESVIEALLLMIRHYEPRALRNSGQGSVRVTQNKSCENLDERRTASASNNYTIIF